MATYIPSSSVGMKINEWYKHIKKFDILEAKRLKAEVESEIEENQDLLLYYSLVEYRHKIMLQHVNPLALSDDLPDYKKVLEQMENQFNSKKEYDSLISYYYNFFRGMDEFKNNDYLKAIIFYRKAEKHISAIDEETEKAEFYFKIAEVFYHMKQTYFSLYYITLARDIFIQDDTFKLKAIQCNLVIAGNLIDGQRHEEALTQLTIALQQAKSLKNEYFISLCTFNLGEVHYTMGNLNKAIPFFEKGIILYKKTGSINLGKAIYSLATAYFKIGRIDDAQKLCKDGIKAAYNSNDLITQAKFNYLQALYSEPPNEEVISQTFSFLESKKLFPELEELALDVANYYSGIESFELAISYFNRVTEYRREIQKGECLYELKI
ncbi:MULTISPECIES: Rap family tetratricopeptide repeat protein [Bacillus subtilis group]|uniref:Rap family tetratricopeptide repeat protein n=1 Tax=Bacillus subtilis group TaxID=653685 RepID=UPI0011A2C4B8|nr:MULTISPECIES: Rap family tetratricopeptide repeat protein [Bacillus subtilis group]MEC2189688.1 aspartate phosphatase [Bacillus spizizenii]MEC2297031.1 aspartate phosphatase [Bacillus subtilis]MEC2403648.1 aspartate phosphatase [Bacillus subtilis]MED4660897.1 aspartate phosphatase [Bacillus subtilis]MED4667475.1 aspartate phosphatase [Bacillus subtilis]